MTQRNRIQLLNMSRLETFLKLPARREVLLEDRHEKLKIKK